jgi:hypothetical protein
MHQIKSKFKIHIQLKQQQKLSEGPIFQLCQILILPMSSSRDWLETTIKQASAKFFIGNGWCHAIRLRDKLQWTLTVAVWEQMIDDSGPPILNRDIHQDNQRIHNAIEKFWSNLCKLLLCALEDIVVSKIAKPSILGKVCRLFHDFL